MFCAQFFINKDSHNKSSYFCFKALAALQWRAQVLKKELVNVKTGHSKIWVSSSSHQGIFMFLLQKKKYCFATIREKGIYFCPQRFSLFPDKGAFSPDPLSFSQHYISMVRPNFRVRHETRHCVQGMAPQCTRIGQGFIRAVFTEMGEKRLFKRGV